MIRNLLRITFRVLKAQLSYSVINILGLSLGILASMLILLFVQDELSYDSQHKHAEQIFRVESGSVFNGNTKHWAASQGFLLPAMVNRYPEIIESVKFTPTSAPVIFRTDEETFSETKVSFADSAFFNMFSYDFIYGDPKTCLKDNHGLVITQSTAKKYFGAGDPLGKILTSEHRSYSVTGVIKDVPAQSHFHFDMVIPLNDLRTRLPDLDGGTASIFYSYVMLAENSDSGQFFEKANHDVYELFGFNTSADSTNVPKGLELSLHFKPIRDIHLSGNVEKEIEANFNIQSIYVFITIAIFILLIAIINYINLATAQSTRRAKEVGMRKVLGAPRLDLFYQFMFESMLLTCISFILSLVLMILLLPMFNDLTGKEFTPAYLLGTSFIFNFALIILVVGIISGIYPALVLSGFEPLKAIRSHRILKAGNSTRFTLRRALVVLQFWISVMLSIGAITIHQQLTYVRDKDIGFQTDQVLVLQLPGRGKVPQLETLKNEILKTNHVVAAAPSSVVPGDRVHIMGVRIPSLSDDQDNSGTQIMRILSGDEDLVETFGLEIVEGRDLSKDNPSDRLHGFLVNEAAVRSFGLEDPIGKAFEYNFAVDSFKQGTIIGVLKDFHYASLHSDVEPIMLHVWPRFNAFLNVRMQTENIKETVAEIQEKWEKVLPDVPFNYYFLDDSYNKLYQRDKLTGKTVTFFTGLAFFIALIGLFGLLSFMVDQRTKEIGVRKVLGATRLSIFLLVSREFVFLAFLAGLLAIYPAYYFTDDWLRGFAFHITISGWFYVLSILFGIVVALAISGIKVAKATRTNPIRALRYE
jgi:putative ABC transport system permease protein